MFKDNYGDCFTINKYWENLTIERQNMIQFFTRFQKENEDEIIQDQLHASINTFKEAQLLFSFAFGGPQLASDLNELVKFPQEQKKKIIQLISSLCWNQHWESDRIFSQNLYKLSELYYIIENLLDEITDKVANQLFQNVCKKSSFLFSTKVRINRLGKQEKKIRKGKEKQDQNSIAGNRYVVIFEPKKGQFLLSMLKTNNQYDTISNFSDLPKRESSKQKQKSVFTNGLSKNIKFSNTPDHEFQNKTETVKSNYNMSNPPRTYANNNPSNPPSNHPSNHPSNPPSNHPSNPPSNPPSNHPSNHPSNPPRTYANNNPNNYANNYTNSYTNNNPNNYANNYTNNNPNNYANNSPLRSQRTKNQANNSIPLQKDQTVMRNRNLSASNQISLKTQQNYQIPPIKNPQHAFPQGDLNRNKNKNQSYNKNGPIAQQQVRKEKKSMQAPNNKVENKQDEGTTCNCCQLI